MEEIVKNFIKNGNSKLKFFYITLDEIKSKRAVKTLPNQKESLSTLVFFDTPKFDFLKKNFLIAGKKCGKRTSFYVIFKNERIAFSKNSELFSQIFPFLEIRSKTRKVQIYLNGKYLNATLYSDVTLVNPLADIESKFNDFLEISVIEGEEIKEAFFDLPSFFKENCFEKFRELKIPYILNEEKLNLKIDKDEPISSALLKAIRKQTYKIEGFCFGVLKNLHPEYVHEMRVAFRKTRSYLNTFKEVFGQKRSAALSIASSSFAYDLGLLRDLDVFQIHLNNFLDEIDSRGKKEEILGFFAAKRREEFEIAQRIFSSEKLSRFLLRLKNFSKDKERTNIFGRKPFSESGFEKLSSLKATIKKRYKKYEKTGTMEFLHKVRISFKKFRYLFEILEPFYGKNSGKIKQKLSDIQDCLGFLQDLQIARNLIEESANFI
ncbi:MAG: CHAD domain-containing protein, partial [Acidobacteria bacterium]|nr:CHAD domain-containing protein [Acidobacteriota bacterium]